MMEHVDEVIELSEVGLCRVAAGGWDFVYALSNELRSASLASVANAKKPPIGYYMQNGQIKPSNPEAERWLEMAAFDRIKRENKQTYQRHMLAIIGQPNASVPPPLLRITDAQHTKASVRISNLFDGSSRKRVAINIGAGSHWPKKMLSAEQIHEYAHLLIGRNDVNVVLVGGTAESQKADAISN